MQTAPPGRPGGARWTTAPRRAPGCCAASTRPWTRAVRPYDRRRRPATPSWPPTLSELKLVKDEWEIAQLQDAIDATVRGFEDVARVLPADRPVSERLVEGVFGLRARHDGNGVGYSSIVGAGAHATILHWMRNDGRPRPATCC